MNDVETDSIDVDICWTSGGCQQSAAEVHQRGSSDMCRWSSMHSFRDNARLCFNARYCFKWFSFYSKNSWNKHKPLRFDD